MAAKSMPKKTLAQRELRNQIALAGNSQALQRAAVESKKSSDSRCETLLWISPFQP
ncbi:hypothetical protein RBSWK_02915 [Rhodopirellula baltica SWK14]|uniref:Uncharacterized protein n=1 Tax=Rhodopirellula baltica SWK14 TaxID=993516 RepID=L7CFQ6_RHOBT|nr:hypothetical protein RBSWK_02915 [Rhodopirellula baltica SWK14]